jgi:hypothetical protein
MESLPLPTAGARLAAIEARIEALQVAGCAPNAIATAEGLLRLGEAVLEIWVEARGEVPTGEKREGFRLLALHRQGARGEPSFNACRETCRELVYHYNLVTAMTASSADVARTIGLMALVARHLCLFVAGKMEVAGLGEFCCASKPLRMDGK